MTNEKSVLISELTEELREKDIEIQQLKTTVSNLNLIIDLAYEKTVILEKHLREFIENVEGVLK